MLLTGGEKGGWHSGSRAIALGIVLFSATLPAHDFRFEPWEIAHDTLLKLQVNDRLRGEGVNWFGNPLFQGIAVPRTSRYGMLTNRFQLGLLLNHSDWLESQVQFQNVTVAGIPADGVGVGYAYYLNSPHTTQNAGYLRQGWMKFNHDGLYLSGGRQFYTDGTQTAARQKNLKWLQDNRLNQRLIGTLEFSAAGRSFDGGTIGYANEQVDIQGFGFVPTFGGVNIQGMNAFDNLALGGISLNLKDSDAVGDTIARLAWFNHVDHRPGAVVVDNTPGVPQPGLDLNVQTLGAHAAHVHNLGPGRLDVMGFAFGQFGRWQDLAQRAWAFGLEMGYQWPDAWATPWLRAGINSGSGDNNPNDGTHGTFFQMMPSTPYTAPFPFYNMMNNQDLFVQLLLRPQQYIGLRADVHALTVNAREDLYYTGSGASNANDFGYFGSPTFGATSLAYVAHIGSSVYLSEHLTLNVFYAHAFGQAILQRNYSNADGDFGLMEAVMTF